MRLPAKRLAECLAEQAPGGWSLSLHHGGVPEYWPRPGATWRWRPRGLGGSLSPSRHPGEGPPWSWVETLLAAQELMDIYSPGQNHTSGKGGRCLSGQVCLLPAPAGQHLNVGHCPRGRAGPTCIPQRCGGPAMWGLGSLGPSGPLATPVTESFGRSWLLPCIEAWLGGGSCQVQVSRWAEAQSQLGPNWAF